MGAGAIGGYVGVRLSSCGLPVTLVGRDTLKQWAPLSAQALGSAPSYPRDDLRIETEAEALQPCDIVLLCTKSADTLESAAALQSTLRKGTPVISLQNGLYNVRRIQKAAPNLQAVPGLVTFNVVREAGHFAQATSGPILLGPGAGTARAPVQALVEGLRCAGDAAQTRDDIEQVQAGKLMLNLNNGICAATGLSVRDSILDRRLRRVLSLAMTEARAVLRATGRRDKAIGILSPALIARMLPLPDVIFERVARRMLTINPRARSSTLQDLHRGRKTEIEDLNGAIVTMAQSAGLRAPVNQVITAHVHRLEQAQAPLPFVGPQDLYTEVGAALRGGSARN